MQLRVKGAPTAEVVARGRGARRARARPSSSTTTSRRRSSSADGVHLGQSDPGVERARAAGLPLGLSVEALEQAVAEPRRDYLGVGPIWETPSKHDADPALGLDELARICLAVSTPVVAIGGIDASNAATCIRAGAAGVAVIRAAPDPALRRAVDEALAAR